MKITFLFCLTALVFASCRPKPIDIEVDSAPSKLVVFSHAVPNNVMIVSLTKSFSALDGLTEEQFQDLLVTGATVKVVVDGVLYDFYELTPGFYASFTSVIPNAKTFELIATHNGETVTSITTTSKKVDFSIFQPIVEKTPADTNVFLQLGFDDIAGESNYYMINIYRKNDGQTVDGVNYFNNGSNLLAKTILVSDLEFNGTYNKTIPFDNLHHEDSIAVTLSNISKEYYNYLTLKTQSGSVFNQLNLEPLNYPTNIVNGYGFFNAHIPDLKFDDLGQY
jgi:Domain of unknown function (DUF4249)